MGKHLPERDWNKLRALKNQALENLCNRILDEVSATLRGREHGSHQTYLTLWRILDTEDKALSLMFDGLKRSTAISKLALWKKNGLLDDLEFSEFTDETRSRADNIIAAMY